MHSLDEVSGVLDEEQTRAFHQNPIDVAIRLDETAFHKVFALIERRLDPLVYDFKRSLLDISYVRAGWDYPDNPADQKAAEASLGQKSLASAREMWAKNPARHNDLRNAFRELQPLATLDEIAK